MKTEISLYLLFGLYIGYFYITIDYEKICYTCHKRECVLKDTDAGQELVERKRDGGNRWVFADKAEEKE